MARPLQPGRWMLPGKGTETDRIPEGTFWSRDARISRTVPEAAQRRERTQDGPGDGAAEQSIWSKEKPQACAWGFLLSQRQSGNLNAIEQRRLSNGVGEAEVPAAVEGVRGDGGPTGHRGRNIG